MILKIISHTWLIRVVEDNYDKNYVVLKHHMCLKWRGCWAHQLPCSKIKINQAQLIIHCRTPYPLMIQHNTN